LEIMISRHQMIGLIPFFQDIILSKRIIGESKIVDDRLFINFKESYKSNLNEYESRNVYNCDETGLFWKCSSNRTYTISKEDKASGKFSKDRITILFGVNMLEKN